MFEANENGEIPFHNAVKCVIATITDKIISRYVTQRVVMLAMSLCGNVSIVRMMLLEFVFMEQRKRKI